RPQPHNCDSLVHFQRRVPVARSEYLSPSPTPSGTILPVAVFVQATAAAPFRFAVAWSPSLLCRFDPARSQLLLRGPPKQTNTSCGESGNSRRLRRTSTGLRLLRFVSGSFRWLTYFLSDAHTRGLCRMPS